MDAWTVLQSPLGPLTLVGGAGGIRSLHFADDAPSLAAASRENTAPGLRQAASQLGEYFAGTRRRFTLEVDLHGTPLERRVWDELVQVPYGRTITYTQLAAAVGRPDIVRAVAGAVARTPTPILLPCHRVVGADGSLRGYIGGLERKAALLDLERRQAGEDGAGAGRPHQLRLL